jgi:radical SAM protein with 4Fe4S-binding SPASM domain
MDLLLADEVWATPYSYKVIDHKGHRIILAPDVGAWLVTDELGVKLFGLLAKGLRPRDALIDGIRDWTEDKEQASQVLRRLVEVLLVLRRTGFLRTREEHDALPILDLTVTLTHRCNLRCVHCLCQAGPEKGTLSEELSTKEIKTALVEYSKLTEMGRVTLTGGEPFLRSDLYEIVKHCHELGLRPVIFTNGFLLDEEVMNRYAPFLVGIQVSLDGATREVHDRVRGQGSFERAFRAIRLAKRAGKRVAIAVTLNPFNVEDFRANYTELSDIVAGAEVAVNVGSVFAKGRALETWPGDTFDNLVSEVDELSEKFLALRGERRFLGEGQKKRINCGFGPGMTLDQDGTVYPCNKGTAFPMGSVKTDPMDKIHEKVLALYYETSVDNVPDCKDCDVRYRCGGRCRVVCLEERGSLFDAGCTEKTHQAVLDTFLLSHRTEDALIEDSEALERADSLLSAGGEG